MTIRTLTALASQVGMATFIGLTLGYVDLYMFYSGTISFPAAYIYLAFLLGFCAILLVRATRSARLMGEIIAVYTANIWVLVALFLIIGFGFVFAFLPDAYWSEGPHFLLFPVYDTIVVVLAMLLPVLKQYRDHFEWYVFCAFVILLTSIFVDVQFPGTFSLVTDRAAGFGENPNTAGFVLVLLCCCVVDFERERPRNLVALALTSLGVLSTLSRGAVILLTVLFGYYLYRVVYLNRHRLRRLFHRAVVVGLLLIAILGTGMFIISRAEIFALSFQPRLGMLSGTEEVVPADEDRLYVLQMHLKELALSPVIGYGTGHTYSLSTGPHNIYVQQWINNGLPGLAAYLVLMATCVRVFWRRRFHRGLTFMVLIIINGLFNHNILEERAFLTLLGVLLTTSFYKVLELESSRAVVQRFVFPTETAGFGTRQPWNAEPRFRTKNL